MKQKVKYIDVGQMSREELVKTLQEINPDYKPPASISIWYKIVLAVVLTMYFTAILLLGKP